VWWVGADVGWVGCSGGGGGGGGGCVVVVVRGVVLVLVLVLEVVVGGVGWGGHCDLFLVVVYVCDDARRLHASGVVSALCADGWSSVCTSAVGLSLYLI